jgi:hypothetical protein
LSGGENLLTCYKKKEKKEILKGFFPFCGMLQECCYSVNFELIKIMFLPNGVTNIWQKGLLQNTKFFSSLSIRLRE